MMKLTKNVIDDECSWFKPTVLLRHYLDEVTFEGVGSDISIIEVAIIRITRLSIETKQGIAICSRLALSWRGHIK
jgi:hypothetical protein